jgi:hypothetical protein
VRYGSVNAAAMFMDGIHAVGGGIGGIARYSY